MRIGFPIGTFLYKLLLKAEGLEHKVWSRLRSILLQFSIDPVRRLLINGRLNRLYDEIERNRMLLVQPRIREFATGGILPHLADAEFRVFSQWGEDGIIQYLLAQIATLNPRFIEFGVQDYSESNTRFLLLNNNWRGLVIDGGPHYIKHIRTQEYYWRHDLTALCAFITRANINDLFVSTGFTGEIGLLSIDIDGNDYWVWEAISTISPQIVVMEYNSLFGPNWPVTVPYNAQFQYTNAHYSNCYFGASLGALCHLAERKGYRFVGVNSAGINAFFVRADVVGSLRVLTCSEDFVASRVRQSHDQQGHLTFIGDTEQRKLIANLPLVNVATGAQVLVRDLV